MTSTGARLRDVAEREPDLEEILGIHRPEGGRPYPDWAARDSYPRLTNHSAAFMYSGMIRALEPQRPEYVTVPIRHDNRLELELALTQWNILWEAAQFRRRFFDEEDLPGPLYTAAERGDVNVVFVPRTPSRYHEYSPLFHMLPASVVERFGLPLVQVGQWPFLADLSLGSRMPRDFESRLANAWSSTIWRRLISGSSMGAFDRNDPIRLLAHNLDFWIPAATDVMEDILRSLPEVDEGVVEGPVPLEDGSVLDGAIQVNPRMGSDLWRGEEDAAEILDLTVEAADQSGQLRSILEAIRSNRVEDDFSDRWSFAREDFERRLHRKRSKVKVSFVELTDTIPVQGPETEVVGSIVTADFLAVLDERQRQVVVMLNSGFTSLTDIAEQLGYANHSPISKRLAKIRTEAARFFDDA